MGLSCPTSLKGLKDLVAFTALAGGLAWSPANWAGSWALQSTQTSQTPPTSVQAGCTHASGLPAGLASGSPSSPNLAGMKPVPAGHFRLGSDSGYAEERGGGRVEVAGFSIDAHEVTNAQFSAFVQATGYVTDAERAGASAVFVPPKPGQAYTAYSWWHWVQGADWRHPQGPGSSLAGLGAHPVVQVTLADAQAYARWLGRSLPTEVQWEYAARGGLSEAAAEQEDAAANTPQYRRRLLKQANTWQGSFPERNSAQDGWRGTAPVGCFAPNGFGLYDMVGNVWELTADNWRSSHDAAQLAVDNPDVVRMDNRVSRAQQQVIKGGSYLCAPDFCVRYRASSRQPQDASLGTSHIGFRTVVNGAGFQISQRPLFHDSHKQVRIASFPD